MNTAVLRLTLALLLGVSLGFYLVLSVGTISTALAVAFLLFMVAFYRARKMLFSDTIFGTTTFLLFFILGVFTTSIHLPNHQSRHFIHQIPSEENAQQLPILQVEILEVLKPDLYNEKYIAEVESVGTNPTHGKLLLLFPKDSLQAGFSVGRKLLLSSHFKSIPVPLNPHQFNYSRFMANKGVLVQSNLRSGTFKELQTSKNGLRAKAESWRNQIISSLKKNNFQKEELAIVQALLLGQKKDISAETYNNYAAAGAIHILAVSGLHVGIILLILNRIFSPLRRLKKGKFLRTFLVIIFLWGFALLAGLSPSVVRAVTMFSFLAVGMEINRSSSSLNSVFLSLMLLVLINPQWIFEVGFQLSYLAVLSILLLQPVLYRLVRPSTKAGKYVWGLLTTTMAAQAGVLPLSLFYFHQFPGLFFLSNLVILPFLGFILLFGITVIFLALLEILPGFLAEGFGALIELLNQFVAWVAKQESFLFQDVSFGLAEVWVFYFCLLCIVLLALSFSYRKLLMLLVSLIIIQMVYIFQKYEDNSETVIFHKTQNTLIGKTENSGLKIYHNSNISPEELPLIKNYMVGQDLETLIDAQLPNILAIKDGYLLIVDSTGVYPTTSKNIDYLLLSNSPRINLERVLQHINPKAIVADGSNYRTYVDQWRKTSLEKEIPFHATGEKGAFQIK